MEKDEAGMIRPEIAEKVRKKKEREREKAVELPLYPPEPVLPYNEETQREPEETTVTVTTSP